MAAQAVKLPAAARAGSKAAPAVLLFGTAAGLVGTYVYTQLQKESRALDRSFAQYKSAESEASRQRTFEHAKEDPRKSLFNVLSW
ncbi:hypothetical protein GQ53DRAFT_821746 [Thozetella sp. PMI_491]|nr:hypothetical protein GQ53DRAFT_821746 [Thozetella sp. PMI_491]